MNRHFRKILSFLLILMMVLPVLPSCGSEAAQTEMTDTTGTENTANTTDTTEATETADTTDATETADVAETADDPEAVETKDNAESTDAAETDTETSGEINNRILVVTFSCTGNTKPIAQTAAELLNADFYEIVPEIPYTDEDIYYQDENCRANKEQNDDTARPAIAGNALDISDYDTILISFPIWWGKEPRIIDTFMETYDFSGKSLAAFCTSGGSGIDTAENNLKAYTPNSTWLGAMRFQADATGDTVEKWLSEIGLYE